MKIRGIRGAITVQANTVKEIEDGTYELMKKIIESNDLIEEDVVSIIFTATKDLNVQYPSVVVRNRLNWVNTPLLNFEEKSVINGLEKCIRVMLYAYTSREKKEITHVYLREAQKLRPDLCLK